MAAGMGLPDGPMYSPTISRLPSVFTVTAIIDATETIRPPSRMRQQIDEDRVDIEKMRVEDDQFRNEIEHTRRCEPWKALAATLADVAAKGQQGLLRLRSRSEAHGLRRPPGSRDAAAASRVTMRMPSAR
jgi:hypothetical protein